MCEEQCTQDISFCRSHFESSCWNWPNHFQIKTTLKCFIVAAWTAWFTTENMSLRAGKKAQVFHLFQIWINHPNVLAENWGQNYWGLYFSWVFSPNHSIWLLSSHYLEHHQILSSCTDSNLGLKWRRKRNITVVIR